MMTGRSRKLSPPLVLPFLPGSNPLLSLWICPKSVAFGCLFSPIPPCAFCQEKSVSFSIASCPQYSFPLRRPPSPPPPSPSTSLPAMSADLYPQSTYPQRTSYPARPDQSYQLSAVPPAPLVYPPSLISSASQPIPEAQNSDSPTHSSPRESQSPKADNASAAKQDGTSQQQPAKPQATFLTKLYAYVFDASSSPRSPLISTQVSSNAPRTTT